MESKRHSNVQKGRVIEGEFETQRKNPRHQTDLEGEIEKRLPAPARFFRRSVLFLGVQQRL